MKIKVENVRCTIIEWPPKPWDERLRKAFTKRAKQAFWAAKTRPGWSGDTAFISEKRGQFSTGLLPLVLEWAEEEGFDVELDDRRVKPVDWQPNQTFGSFQLRDYQLASLEACKENPRGILKVSTGGGKSLILAALLKHLPCKALLLVERVNLAVQTKDKFVKEYGFKEKEVGIVGDQFLETGRRVTIATVQSAHKLEDLNAYEMVLIDENHHAKAKSYIAVLKNMGNAYYRYGVSGTPFAGDPVEDMYRMTQLGPLLYEISTQELSEKGVLARPTIRFIEITKPNVVGMRPYLNQYKAGIVQNEFRNRLVAKFANELKGKTLILFRMIEHGQILHDLIPNVWYVDGNTPTLERNRIITAFNKSSNATLLGSTVFDEGIDFSAIQHLIIAGGEKSVIKGIQRLGRGLRREAEGQSTVNVIEFLDKQGEILERHSKKRMKLYASEGHEVKIFKL